MSTLSNLVATVVVHSSAAAFSHFGVTLQPVRVEAPAPVSEPRVVARSPKVSDAGRPVPARTSAKPAPLNA